MRDAFQAPFRLADQTPTLTCSHRRRASIRYDARDGVRLIKQADTAMYAAKEAGRNAYRFYTADMNARVQLRLQLETDMRRGLDGRRVLPRLPAADRDADRARVRRRGAACAGAIPSAASSRPAEFIPSPRSRA